MNPKGLGELWTVLTVDMAPESKRLLMRVLRAQAIIVAELVSAAEQDDDRT